MEGQSHGDRQECFKVSDPVPGGGKRRDRQDRKAAYRPGPTGLQQQTRTTPPPHTPGLPSFLLHPLQAPGMVMGLPW